MVHSYNSTTRGLEQKDSKSSPSHTEDSIAKTRQEGQSDDSSVVKSTHCSSRGLELGHQHLHQAPVNHSNSMELQEIQHPLVVPKHGRQIWRIHIVESHMDIHSQKWKKTNPIDDKVIKIIFRDITQGQATSDA